MKKQVFLLATFLLFGISSLYASRSLVGMEDMLVMGSEGKGSGGKLNFSVEKNSELPDLQGRTIIAVTENGYVPLNFADAATGEGIGFEYDLTELVAYLLNANLDWRLTSWDSMINAVKEGQFDVGMDGITITEEREKEIDFSIPYLHSQQMMLVRKDETRFQNKDQFKGNPELLIGAQPGTTQFYTAVYEVLDGNEKNPRIKLLDGFALVVQSLLSGDVDMVLMDRVSAEGYIGVHKNELKIIGDALGDEEFGYIFPPGSDLRGPFNQALEYLQEKGVLMQLEKYWFYQYKIRD